MTELNPHRRVARVFAFACYIVAGLLFVAGIFFTLAAAMMNISHLQLGNVTNQRMAVMMASIFLIIVLMVVLFGWRVQRLFGQQRRQEKLAAKSAVGCLRLGSLGCALWAVPSTATVLLTGKILATGEPAGLREIFVGTSGFILAILLMLSVAWFISANYARLSSAERRHAYEAYKVVVQPLQYRLAEPETRAYVQEQTMEVLGKLDGSLKHSLLEFLSESGLLTGNTRVMLHGADFRSSDLRKISLPEADLREINLELSTLQGAMLFKVNLHSAKLKKVDLSNANLQAVDLRQADLTGAVLEGTNLRDADLTGAKVTDGQLKQARLGNTIEPSGTVCS